LLSVACTAPLSVLFFLSLYGDHRYLHSFPTRRSSDLMSFLSKLTTRTHAASGSGFHQARFRLSKSAPRATRSSSNGDGFQNIARSEEHTSELQSRENLVCRLLLEKKNKKANAKHQDQR